MSLIASISELSHQAAKSAEQQLAEAKQRYREIVSRAAAPQAGDAGKVLKLLDTLGLSQADLAADVVAVAEHARLSGIVATKEAALPKLQDSYDRATVHLGDARKALEVAERAHADALRELNRGSPQFDRIALNDLRAGNPRLFGE